MMFDKKSALADFLCDESNAIFISYDIISAMMHSLQRTTHALIGFAVFIGGVMIAQQGLAWTNPTANPPTGAPLITVSGTNIGIGVTPGAKLDVGGSLTARGNDVRFNTSNNANATIWLSNPTSGPGSAANYYIKSFDYWGPTLHFMADGDNGDEVMNVTVDGRLGVGTATVDANYKITTSGGGIKAESASATQAAGYFNNTGGGAAITAGTGGLTLGGVNRTSWPSGLSGSGTANYVPKFTAGTTIGNSIIIDDGTNVGVGITPAYKLDVAGTVRTTGDLLVNGNYGLGLVGMYSPTRYRNVYSMGAAYRLAADGTGPGNLYGIANTYEPDYQGVGNNAQAKAGLGHQYLFMANGVTQTSIGTGIWTNGNLSFASANPYINASSYFIAPGGAYFNSGTVYFASAIQARGGIHDDINANLSILGGTSGNTTFSGNITTAGTISAGAVYNPTYAP